MKRTRGFTLLEIIVVLVVGAAIVAVIARGLKVYDRARRGAAWGAQMEDVISALEAYGTRYRGLLVAGQPVAGYADPTAPTIAELQDDENGALLPPGFSETPLPGGSYVISVTVTPAGCAAADCDLVYWVYGDTPARRLASNAADIELAATAAAEIRLNRGGWSERDLFRGNAAAWSLPNPTETAPSAGDGTAGLLGALGSYRQGLLAQYLRVDGSNEMEANLSVGGNDIVNARNTNTQQVTFTATATAGGACATANQVTGGADGAPLVCTGGTWRRIGLRTAAVGGTCTGSEIAQDGNSQPLVCRGSAFVALADRLPRVVDVSQAVVSNGAVVAQPTCGAGGTANIALSSQDAGVDFSRIPAPNRLRMTATVSGTNWTITLGLVDQNGNVRTTDGSGNAYNLQAIARTQCVYAS